MKLCCDIESAVRELTGSRAQRWKSRVEPGPHPFQHIGLIPADRTTGRWPQDLWVHFGWPPPLLTPFPRSAPRWIGIYTQSKDPEVLTQIRNATRDSLDLKHPLDLKLQEEGGEYPIYWQVGIWPRVGRDSITRDVFISDLKEIFAEGGGPTLISMIALSLSALLDALDR
jgi:hypothetical protein